MNKLIYGAIGLVAGAVGGWFVSKRRFDAKLREEIEAIKETNALVAADRETKKSDVADDTILETAANVSDKKSNDSESGDDSDSDEDDSEDDFDEKEYYKNWVYDPESDEYDYFDNDDTPTFVRRIDDFVGGDIPYPITQDMYEQKDEPYFEKIHMFIYPHDDRACNADSGEEIENFHQLIGDEEYDTLNDDNSEFSGIWYIRNEKERMDFEVEYSSMEWV